MHDLKEISILESGFIQSTKKLTLYFCSKISSLKPFEFDDSFHHARYAIMRQPVGDTKTAKNFFNNFKIMQKNSLYEKFKLLSITLMSSPIFHSFFVCRYLRKRESLNILLVCLAEKGGVIGNHVLNFWCTTGLHSLLK